MRFNWTPIIIGILLSGLVSFFQNCTSAVPFGHTDYFQSLVNSPSFPYEVGVDQLAYMSCSEQEDIYNDGTFFSFRLGAFDSKGLRIAEDYREHLESVSGDDIPLALSMSQTSARTRLQLAIRTLDNLQLMYVDSDNGDSGLDGSDFNNFFPTLGDETLNTILWSMFPGHYLRTYAAARNAGDSRFEGELKFMKSQFMEQELRTFLSNRGILAVTFAESGEIKPLGPGNFTELQNLADSGQGGNLIAPPSATGGGGVGTSGVNNGAPSAINAASSSYTRYSNDLTSNVYGAAVQPRFKQPLFRGSASPGSDMPPRVLSSVSDIVIDERLQGKSQKPWICPASMQFMIVLPEDAIAEDGNGNVIERCSMNPDPINPSEELKIIRQSLYAEDFYVDMVRRCVVPKPSHTVDGSCYGKNSNTQMTHIINYDSFNSNGCGFGNENGLCPHYASICIRQ